MRCLDYGSGSPRLAIVGGIHGDEPAGVRIVERLTETLADTDLKGTVRLIIANEPAVERGVRYTDTDLNRSFPGDRESDEYETALAPRLLDQLRGSEAILALHTSHSVPPPFAIFSERNESVRRTVTGLPVEYAVDASDLRGSTLDSILNCAVSLEAGEQGTDAAFHDGYEAALAFLRAHGVLTDEEPTFTETTVVKGHTEVPKGGGEPHVHYGNFEEIPRGEVFADDDVHTHRVERDGVVPILASEHGYDDIFGIFGSFQTTIKPPDRSEY